MATAAEVIQFLRDNEFITKNRGKDTVSYAGLLHAAYEIGGLSRLDTEMIQAANNDNGQTSIYKAVATFERDGKIYRVTTGHGDANVENVGRMIAPHCPRMAETRAKARALRDGINVAGLVATEELGGDEDDVPASRKQEDPPRRQREEPAGSAHRAQLRHALDLLGRQDVAIPDDLTKTAAMEKLAKLQPAVDAAEKKRKEDQNARGLSPEDAQDEAIRVEPPTLEQLTYLKELMTELGIRGNVPSTATRLQLAGQILKLEEKMRVKVAALETEAAPL